MRKSTLQRMLQLADIKPVIKESKITLSNFELVKESVNGKTYAIVRENNKYHIKEAQTKNGLTESDFNYVGGVMNKMKKSFHSYSDATKHLNLMFEEINNHHDVDVINILESDQLLNEKKFVLKLDKKKKSKPAPPAEEPVADEGGEEEEEFDFGGGEEKGDTEGEEDFDFGGEEDTEGEEDFDFGAEEEGDTEGEEDFDFGGEEEGDTEETDVEEFGDEGDEDLELEDSDDEIKDIQSTTGKLGQQLRDVEDISSDMQKWVAKSVLSALDLDTMDSEDKKDIIKTIKKKKEEPAEEEGGDEEFDFGGEEEEMEESYDNYMGGDYDDDMDGMDGYDWDGVNVEDEFPSYEDVYEKDVEMKDIEMPIKNKRHLNLDPANTKNPYDDYDSYMEEKGFNEEAFDSFMEEMGELGITSKDSKYESYMEDIVGTPNPNDEYSPNRRSWESKEEDTELGGDEKDRVAEPDEVGDDMLLLDIDEDMSPEEMDALYGPNNRRPRYDRSEYSRAKRQADSDISKHYHRPAAPGYEIDPVEKWAKHKLPYDYSEFMGESREINEDHLNDEMETYEQEKAYEDVETVVRRYGMDVKLREKQTSEDPEETLIYLDIVDGDKKLLVARINSVGDIEVGEMRGNKFSGEPLDSVEDFIEIFGEDLTSKERKDLDMDITMMPQPQRAPEKQPNEPATKPGKPEKTPGKDRPSRRPFTPPPGIEEPAPKAPAPEKLPTADNDVEFE